MKDPISYHQTCRKEKCAICSNTDRRIHLNCLWSLFSSSSFYSTLRYQCLQASDDWSNLVMCYIRRVQFMTIRKNYWWKIDLCVGVGSRGVVDDVIHRWERGRIIHRLLHVLLIRLNARQLYSQNEINDAQRDIFFLVNEGVQRKITCQLNSRHVEERKRGKGREKRRFLLSRILLMSRYIIRFNIQSH